MAEPQISVVNENICAKLGEGPHWDVATQKLLWVDCFDDSVHLLDTETGKDERYKLDGLVGSAVPRKKGGSLLVASQLSFTFLDLETLDYLDYLQRSRRDWIIETGKKEVVATVDDDKPENHLNDGKCDPAEPVAQPVLYQPLAGRFWAGTMGPEAVPTKVTPEQGSLFSFTGDRKLTKWVDKISISNGLTWSLDKKTFYYIDSFTRKIYAFDYDEVNGAISNRRTAVEIDVCHGRLQNTILFLASAPSYPDGMTIDAEGMLWVALYDGWKVAQFNPTTGTFLRQINLPVSKVTSCCWGGSNLDELFVTCESMRLSPEQRKAQPHAGTIFKITNIGTHGLPAVAFDG